MSDEEIQKNISNGLLPCGCEKGACKCTISAFEYVMKYKKFMGAMVKGNKEVLNQNKGNIIKTAGKFIKDSFSSK